MESGVVVDFGSGLVRPMSGLLPESELVCAGGLDVYALVDGLETLFGRAEIGSMVVCIGDVGSCGVGELDERGWADIIEHLRGVYGTVLSFMQELAFGRRKGRLVVVLERHRVGVGNRVMREGVLGMVRSLAKEFGRQGTICNVVVCEPGSMQGVEATRFLLSVGASFVNGDRWEV